MPQKSSNKKKASAKEKATQKMASRRDAPQRPKAGRSETERSQSRFLGERPLTGEDRPTNKSGGKITGQAARPAATSNRKGPGKAGTRTR